MSRDYWINMSRDNGGVRFVVNGPGLPQAGYPLALRARWQTDEQLSNRLRLGDADAPTIQQVAATVSQWVLGTDLEVLLTLQIAAGPGPLRLIWNVEHQLRRELAEVPFEIIFPNGGVNPYIAAPEISGFTHQLPKVGNPPASISRQNWPLRCLLLRSNPKDLGRAVPAALPLVAEIRKDVAAVAPQQFQIDVLTSESFNAPVPAGSQVLGPPTFQALEAALLGANYDIFVYLGHGDFDSVHTDQEPVGLLQLEDDTNTIHQSVAADKFSYLFRVRPVPVALLLGCLTAKELDQATRPLIDQRLPKWMRGNEGVAQALVNSVSGVALAVGMRYRTEAKDAATFLRAFFASLLTDPQNKGDVEAAVRFARRRLYTQGEYAGSWVAPMVFSSLPAEPMFPFLAAPPTCPGVEQHVSFRALLWDMRAKVMSVVQPDPDADASTRDGLEKIEAELIGKVTQTATLVMPKRMEVVPGQTVDVPIELHGPLLDVQRLELRLQLDVVDASFTGLQPAPGLAAVGFQISEVLGGTSKQKTLRIERQTGMHKLPPGVLAILQVQVGSIAKTVCPIGLDVQSTEPKAAVCALGNAVLVLLP